MAFVSTFLPETQANSCYGNEWGGWWDVNWSLGPFCHLICPSICTDKHVHSPNPEGWRPASHRLSHASELPENLLKCVRNQKMPTQNMLLWHQDYYSELKTEYFLYLPRVGHKFPFVKVFPFPRAGRGGQLWTLTSQRQYREESIQQPYKNKNNPYLPLVYPHILCSHSLPLKTLFPL